MPSPLEKTINKVADTVEELFNRRSATPPIVTELSLRNGGKQTCLEKYGIRLRAEHIEQNTWRKNDIEYSKPLIDAEYMIQTEFKVGSTDATVEEQHSDAIKREEKAKAKEIKKNKTERDKKRDEKASRTPDQESSKPRQDIKRTESVTGEIASKNNTVSLEQQRLNAEQIEGLTALQRFIGGK